MEYNKGFYKSIQRIVDNIIEHHVNSSIEDICDIGYDDKNLINRLSEKVKHSIKQEYTEQEAIKHALEYYRPALKDAMREAYENEMSYDDGSDDYDDEDDEDQWRYCYQYNKYQ